MSQNYWRMPAETLTPWYEGAHSYYSQRSMVRCYLCTPRLFLLGVANAIEMSIERFTSVYFPGTQIVRDIFIIAIPPTHIGSIS